MRRETDREKWGAGGGGGPGPNHGSDTGEDEHLDE